LELAQTWIQLPACGATPSPLMGRFFFHSLEAWSPLRDIHSSSKSFSCDHWKSLGLSLSWCSCHALPDNRA
jgi:hypothetical protein